MDAPQLRAQYPRTPPWTVKQEAALGQIEIAATTGGRADWITAGTPRTRPSAHSRCETSRVAAGSRVVPGEPRRWWRGLAVVEVALAPLCVLLDVLVPTFLLLALAGLSLLLRRQGPASLGFHRLDHPARAAGVILGLTLVWSGLQLGVFRPVLEHLTGQRQDVSQYADVKGNLGLLLALVALSWTLAALGEETAYRGFVLSRAVEVVGGGAGGRALGIIVSSALFGMAHTEQGVVGVGLTFLDGLFWCWLRYRYGSIWAPVLAHGINNTIGLTAYYVLGPVDAFW